MFCFFPIFYSCCLHPHVVCFQFWIPSSFLLFLRLCRLRGVPMITRLQMINVESLLLFPGQWVCMIFLYFIYLLLIFLFDYVLRKWEWWKGWILIWNQMGCFWFCKCEIVNCIFIKLGLKIWVWYVWLWRRINVGQVHMYLYCRCGMSTRDEMKWENKCQIGPFFEFK